MIRLDGSWHHDSETRRWTHDRIPGVHVQHPPFPSRAYHSQVGTPNGFLEVADGIEQTKRVVEAIAASATTGGIT